MDDTVGHRYESATVYIKSVGIYEFVGVRYSHASDLNVFTAVEEYRPARCVFDRYIADSYVSAFYKANALTGAKPFLIL